MQTETQEFLSQGHVTIAPERTRLETARERVFETLSSLLPGIPMSFDDFHKTAPLERINEIRLGVIRSLGSDAAFRRLILDSVRGPLEALIGPEIAMQRQIGLVLQPPMDRSSILSLHTDVWSGCSPYEVILWMPLSRVHGTKSMYLVPRRETESCLREFRDSPPPRDAEALYERVRQYAHFVNLEFGEALLFSPSLLHGAVVNKTQETRFVLNVRFKSLFSPYGSKGLGETFLPVSMLPATELGLSYEREHGAVRAR